MKLRVETRATRIDLAGGTLDIWPIYLFHPGALTVNCAITRYASCVVETGRVARPGDMPDFARHEAPGKLCFLRGAGTRAALPAAIAGAVGAIFSATDGLDPNDGFAGAGRRGHWRFERDGRGHLRCARPADRRGSAPGGLDSYQPRRGSNRHSRAYGNAGPLSSSVWRRRQRFIWNRGGERREEIGCDLDETRASPRAGALLHGKPKQHGINNWEVFQRHIRGDRRIWRNLARITDVARRLFAALNRNKWEETGRLIREEWEFRRRNLPTISTPVIDRVIAAARRRGAMAGKVCGAGGGGCVALLIDPASASESGGRDPRRPEARFCRMGSIGKGCASGWERREDSKGLERKLLTPIGQREHPRKIAFEPGVPLSAAPSFSSARPLASPNRQSHRDRTARATARRRQLPADPRSEKAWPPHWPGPPGEPPQETPAKKTEPTGVGAHPARRKRRRRSTERRFPDQAYPRRN